jgi:DNA modification methylase
MKDKTVHLNLKPSGVDFEFYPEKYSLYHADCFDVFKHIEDKSIDAIITDPPYGTTACKWDSVIPFDKMWEQLNRIIKPNGAVLLFGSEPFSSYLRISNINKYKYDWKWDKVVGSNFVHAKRMPLKLYEDIIVFNANGVYNPIFINRDKKNERKSGSNKGINLVNVKYMQTDTKDKLKYPTNKIEINRLSKELNSSSVLHPTQKPVELMEYLIKTYTKENETVLDFTMGSGSTGVACINTGRKFVGIEKEKQYYDIACSRISRAVGVLNSNAPTLNFEQSTEL